MLLAFLQSVTKLLVPLYVILTWAPLAKGADASF